MLCQDTKLTRINATFGHCHRYLRAHNPKSSAYARQEARKRLRTFEQRCDLVTYLGSNIDTKEEDRAEQPFDFNFKVEEFLALQQSS